MHLLCFFIEYEKNALLRQDTIETENFVIELSRPLDKSLDCVLPGKLVLALLDVFSVFSFPRHIPSSQNLLPAFGDLAI